MKRIKFTKTAIVGMSMLCATATLSSCGFSWGDHDDDNEVVLPPQSKYDYILPYLVFGATKSQVQSYMNQTQFRYKLETNNSDLVSYAKNSTDKNIVYGYSFDGNKMDKAMIILNYSKYTITEARKFLEDNNYVFAYSEDGMYAYLAKDRSSVCFIMTDTIDKYNYITLGFVKFTMNNTPAGEADVLQQVKQKVLEYAIESEATMQHSQQWSQE